MAGLSLIALALIGLPIGSDLGMPSNARVFVNPKANTYLAPPCLELTADQEQRWRDNLPGSLTYRDSMGAFVTATGLIPAVVSEVDRQGLKPDPDCRDQGAFRMEARSATGMFLERIGILHPLPSRWNPDGSWNW